MKKLLNIIGASVILSSSAVVASCSLDPSAPIEINDAIDLQNFFNKLQNNRPELSSDYNVAFDGQNAKYIAALEEIFDQEKVVCTPFIQKLLATINVISGSTVYDADGSVPVTFAIIPASKPLTADLTVVELGDIKDNKEATILAAVKAKNTAVDETQLEVADMTPEQQLMLLKILKFMMPAEVCLWLLPLYLHQNH
jgi:hypothetical protein